MASESALYFATTSLEDRAATSQTYGGLAGERYSRHFHTEGHFLAFFPVFMIERVLRGGREDITLRDGNYRLSLYLL